MDFLDTDNWDCIRKVEVDKQNGLIWFYWQIPSGDPFEEEIRKMVFPLGYYGMCLKFDNLRFLIGKRNKCLGIVVNGYTIQNKDVEKFAKHGNWKVKATDAKSSFFYEFSEREKWRIPALALYEYTYFFILDYTKASEHTSTGFGEVALYVWYREV